MDLKQNKTKKTFQSLPERAFSLSENHFLLHVLPFIFNCSFCHSPAYHCSQLIGSVPFLTLPFSGEPVALSPGHDCLKGASQRADEQFSMQISPPTCLHVGRCPPIQQPHTFHGVKTTACGMWSSCQSGAGVKIFAHGKHLALSCHVRPV